MRRTAAGSLATIAVGAILAFAISVSTPGFSLPAVGVILVLVGAAGLVVACYVEYSRQNPAERGRPVERRYVEPQPRYAAPPQGYGQPGYVAQPPPPRYDERGSYGQPGYGGQPQAYADYPTYEEPPQQPPGGSGDYPTRSYERGGS